MLFIYFFWPPNPEYSGGLSFYCTSTSMIIFIFITCWKQLLNLHRNFHKHYDLFFSILNSFALSCFCCIILLIKTLQDSHKTNPFRKGYKHLLCSELGERRGRKPRKRWKMLSVHKSRDFQITKRLLLIFYFIGIT